MNLHQAVRTACLLGFAVLSSLPGTVLADQNSAWNTLTSHERQQILSDLDIEPSNSSSGQRFRAITGVRNMPQAVLNDQWHHDQQSGKDRGLKLVWQGSANLISVSETGLSLTRRF